ncbi:hypothetical protein GCM10022631_29470 [Deinococcus rubellus]|uniref:DUF2259 domain-containing protein n=1 Tax=Deinococcus rubellus TaxID=1889240 RepID=A0ABY5YG86_9DEIO|nr:hypothetical protein [Deinococcus rubellus]UWX63412.1 hypothetical protein N0D28_11735 [Deinococcus rubellus]
MTKLHAFNVPRQVILLSLLTLWPALAYTAAPTAAQIQNAYDAGQKLAQNTDSGYPGGEYLVYAVPDALKLEAQNGSVDAVLAGTPLERTRYESFLSALGEDPITPQQARERTQVPDHTIEFLVYAHGSTPEDQSFQAKFSAARLTLGGQTFNSTSTDKSDTSSSLYPRTAGEIGVRYTGIVMYHFKVPVRLDGASGTLRFTDATGKTFRLAVNLSRYR